MQFFNSTFSFPGSSRRLPASALAACWLKTTSTMQPIRQKCTPGTLGTSEIQPLRQRGRRKCDPFSRKCTRDPLGTTNMQPLRQKMFSHAQIHPREAICPLSGRNGFQTHRNRSFFTCIGMPPRTPQSWSSPTAYLRHRSSINHHWPRHQCKMH